MSARRRPCPSASSVTANSRRGRGRPERARAPLLHSEIYRRRGRQREAQIVPRLFGIGPGQHFAVVQRGNPGFNDPAKLRDRVGHPAVLQLQRLWFLAAKEEEPCRDPPLTGQQAPRRERVDRALQFRPAAENETVRLFRHRAGLVVGDAYIAIGVQIETVDAPQQANARLAHDDLGSRIPRQRSPCRDRIRIAEGHFRPAPRPGPEALFLHQRPKTEGSRLVNRVAPEKRRRRCPLERPCGSYRVRGTGERILDLVTRGPQISGIRLQQVDGDPQQLVHQFAENASVNRQRLFLADCSTPAEGVAP